MAGSGLASYPGVRLEVDQPVKMRDGCVLLADVYRPDTPGPHGVLLMRQPYGKQIASTVTYAHPVWYAAHGFVVVVQDVRGRGRSEGEFYPFRNESDDGYDSVEWCATLAGTTGRVGMYGFSYQGATQLLAAAARPPHLAAIAPAMTAADFYDGWTYLGGALALSFATQWANQLELETALRAGDEALASSLAGARQHPNTLYEQLPLTSVTPLSQADGGYFNDWVAHPQRDSYWDACSADMRAMTDLPALHIAGWYDTFLPATVHAFESLTAAGVPDQVLLIGPWQHMPWGHATAGLDFGPEVSSRLVDDLQVAWFSHWLNDADVDFPNRSRFFITGRNAWSDIPWQAPSGGAAVLYLASDGRANSDDGDGTLSLAVAAGGLPDVYVHDPASPVPTVSSGGVFSSYDLGQYDLRAIEARNDVLVYTTAQLSQSMVLLGELALELWASSTGADTDFVVHLVEVLAGGQERALSFGVLRARFRTSFSQAEWLTPGSVELFRIRLRPVGHELRAGSRIRIMLAGSCFPLIDRNAGRAIDPASVRLSDFAKTTQLVFHDEARPSALRLPAVGAELSFA